MSSRFLLLLTFVAAASLTLWLPGAEAQPNTMKQVGPGVWFRHGDLMNEGHCNNVVIEMKDGLLVVDANFPSGARALLADLKRFSSKPVKWVFDTHHHGDHAYANATWTRMGAETWAYAAVTDEMKRYEPKRWLGTNREDVKELNLPTAEPPQKTFTKSPYVIDDGTRRVEFRHFGWAHTRGDGFVYLPKEKILCTGDAATNGPFNFTADGNVGNWPKVLAAAAKLPVDQVLPGHGPNGDRQILVGQAQFMEELLRAVKAEVKKGKKLEDLVKMDNGQPKSTTIQLQAEVKNWVSERTLPGQVRDAYQEIAAKKPAGDLPH